MSNSQLAKTIVFIGMNGRWPVKNALQSISTVLAKKSDFRLPLDMATDRKSREASCYAYVKNSLIAYSEINSSIVENSQGCLIRYIGSEEQDKYCFLSADATEMFAASLGVKLTIELKERSDYPFSGQLPKLGEAFVIDTPDTRPPIDFVPIKVKRQQSETVLPVNINRELYSLRQLQVSLQKPVDEDLWDCDDPNYKVGQDQLKRIIRKKILILSTHVPGSLPTKPISLLAVKLAWLAYLETNQAPPEAKDVLQRMYKLAKRDTGHECLLEPTVSNSGQATVKFQSGKKRPTYNEQACYRTLKTWWASYHHSD